MDDARILFSAANIQASECAAAGPHHLHHDQSTEQHRPHGERNVDGEAIVGFPFERRIVWSTCAQNCRVLLVEELGDYELLGHSADIVKFTDASALYSEVEEVSP